jgi:serine/threonine-protein phosphatase PGAM5
VADRDPRFEAVAPEPPVTPEPGADRPVGKRILYVIRHGHYFIGAPPSGRPAGTLSPLGVEQARLTARRMRRVPFEIIHCSTLRRAMETAAIIRRVRPRAPLRYAHVLRESIPILPRRRGRISRNLRPEAVARAGVRAERALARYFRPSRGPDRHELIVAHGNLIRYLVCRVLGVSPRAWADMGSHHCGVSIVAIRGDGTRALLSYNDTGHLPPRLVT